MKGQFFYTSALLLLGICTTFAQSMACSTANPVLASALFTISAALAAILAFISIESVFDQSPSPEGDCPCPSDEDTKIGHFNEIPKSKFSNNNNFINMYYTIFSDKKIALTALFIIIAMVIGMFAYITSSAIAFSAAEILAVIPVIYLNLDWIPTKECA